ncbi:hypothetical protein ACLOJK_041451 [Asimina triloba]
MEIIPKPVRNLWNNWDIRIFVLCSLFVQILLIFFAQIRKRTSNKLLILFTWSLYLLADWVAAFALGLLANSETSESDCTVAADNIKAAAASAGAKSTGIGKPKNKTIIAFWAPFLVLHLGGPDTITAFAMEDNELWLRHLLGVIFQVGIALYVFLLSIPNTEILVPNLLIFVAGIVKYIERTYALYLASLDGFRDSMLKAPDPGPNYAKLMEEYQSKKEAGIPVVISISPEPEAPEKEKEPQELGQLKAARKAFKLFKTFKGLIVELMFSFHDRAKSRSAFLRWSAKDAFRVIEYELEFLYEVLFTKAAVVHRRLGYFLRAVCSCSITAAFFVFLFTSKHDFVHLDVAISYTLLATAIALDAVALAMLLLSDMTLVKLGRSALLRVAASWIMNTKRPRNRWSVCIAQYNLLRYCLPKHQSYFGRIGDRPTIWGKVSEALYLQKAVNWLTLGMLSDLFDELEYTSGEAVSEKMKEFIFRELKKKSEIMKEPKAARSLCSCRGNWALEQRGYLKEFRESIIIDFDESLLRWHIATTLCYYDGLIRKSATNAENREPPKKQNSESSPKQNQNEETVAERKNEDENRELSKQISDYMIYLLMMQPAMISSVAVSGRIRFRDTCAEAKNFFFRRSTTRESPSIAAALFTCGKDVEEEIGEELKMVCEDLLSVNTVAKPIEVKGDRSKSVLFDGCILAERLKKVGRMRWTIMCEVWVEMLAYAAGRCNGIAHAQRLSKGGELLTFVWFLMAHLGLGEQYRIEAGHARAKLLVGKQ